jgi:hypothetical protein
MTNTKTTFQPPGKSKNPTTAETQGDIHLQSMPNTGGKFYRLSEDSDKSGSERMEVLVTTTVDVESDDGRFDGKRDFGKPVGSAV